MGEVRFDDIDGLNGEAGEFSGWSEPLTVSPGDDHQFAELTGDRQWIHVDVERARRESPSATPSRTGS